MPLSLSNRDQNSGHLFYNRRLRAATTRFSVRMKHDDRKQTAALALSMVLVAIAAGWMMLLNVLKPTGIVGDSAIIGDRDSGALYARIDGRLYPALNLTSARLATGTAGQPTWVKPAEIAKYPTGPLVGIPGAPAAMPVNRGAVSAWAVCDTAGRPRSADKPVVTSIAGPITGGGRATHLRDDAGLLVTFDGSTYVIWGGKRSQIDPTNRAVTLSLGLDPGVTSPIQEAARRTLNRPGFGLTESLHELRIGVPALADPGTGELVGITDVGARIADVAGVTKHASLQRLPQRVELSAIVEHEAVHQGGDDLSIAFAIGERHELGPVPIKLRESPGLMILGRQGCGKTTALVAIGEAVMNRFSPQQAQLTLIDPKTAPHGLRDLHAPGYVRAYAYDQDEIDEVITELAQQILLPRLPPKGLSQEELRALKPWEGPRHFVLIDDVQDLRPAQSYPQKPPVGAALWKLMERARQVGLHVFSTRNSANWATMPMDPWVKSQTSAKVAQLYMDNDPQNRINRSVRAQTLPPGRGLLVGADGDVEGILVGYPSVPGEQ